MTESKSVTVDAGGGADYTSIQAAIDDLIPRASEYEIDINVNAGDYTSEDLYIPPTKGNRTRPNGTERVAIQITGDQSTPSNVKVGSAFVDTC